eukprot:RCo024175
MPGTETFVSPFEPPPRDAPLWRLCSVRAVSLAFFVLTLVLVTALVVVVMMTYSSDALEELKHASSQAMLDISTRTAAIANNSLQQAGDALVRTVELSSSSLMAASASSQAQVQALVTAMLSNSLCQLSTSLQDFLASVHTTVQSTYKLVTSMGLDLNNLDTALRLAPYAFSTLPYEHNGFLAMLGPVSGVAVVYLVSEGFDPIAVVCRGAGDPCNTYAVNTTTLQVIFPSSGCFRGFVSYCNFTSSSLVGPVFDFAATLAAGEMKFGPLMDQQHKFIPLIEAVRASDTTLIGVVVRTADFRVLTSYLQNLFSMEPKIRSYLVGRSGTLLAASHIDPSEDLPFRPYENVLAYPETIVNQSAKFLLQKYGSWANLSFGQLDTANL